MSSALIQRGPISGAVLPRYHRAACGALQLLSKGGAAPAEPRTQRARVRQALEAALLAEEGSEHGSQVPEALLAEQRGSEHDSNVPTPKWAQVKELKDTVEWWAWWWGSQQNPGVKAALTPPWSYEKNSACKNNQAYLREVTASVGAKLSAGGSLGVGYGGAKNGDWAYMKSGGYYTLCAGLGVEASIQPAGLSSATLYAYDNIEGISMVYSGEVCLGLCLGYSNIYCLPWDLSAHPYCGWGYLAGSGAGVSVGWETCATRPVPANLYKPTEEWVHCPQSWR